METSNIKENIFLEQRSSMNGLSGESKFCEPYLSLLSLGMRVTSNNSLEIYQSEIKFNNLKSQLTRLGTFQIY
jgi:hypothetical protein